MEAAGSSETFVPTIKVHDVTSEKSLILSFCQQPSDFPCLKFSAPCQCESGCVGVVCGRYKSLKRLEVSFISRSKVVRPLHCTQTKLIPMLTSTTLVTHIGDVKLHFRIIIISYPHGSKVSSHRACRTLLFNGWQAQARLTVREVTWELSIFSKSF